VRDSAQNPVAIALGSDRQANKPLEKTRQMSQNIKSVSSKGFGLALLRFQIVNLKFIA